MAQRILVVEDNDALRKTLSNSIRSTVAESEVHVAANPAEACALLNAGSYALVLTDLSFTRGGMEGLRLIQEIAAFRKRPGLVAVSGYEMASTLALSMGADAFLSKPVRPAELISLLRDVLNERELTKRTVN